MAVGYLETRVPSGRAPRAPCGHAVELESHLRRLRRPRHPLACRGSRWESSAPPSSSCHGAPVRPAARSDGNARGRASLVHHRAARARFTGGGHGVKPSQTRGVTPGQPGRAWGSPSARLQRRVEEPRGRTRTRLWGGPPLRAQLAGLCGNAQMAQRRPGPRTPLLTLRWSLAPLLGKQCDLERGECEPAGALPAWLGQVLVHGLCTTSFHFRPGFFFGGLAS